ncbi:unnamed protein product [Linum trigynum]|uniref:Uncharacterized protein n=1 Tax=Linum trigynum TaxID=586398 RepID=A0AAV2FSY9_9ROSI
MIRSFLKTFYVVSHGDPDGVVRLDFAAAARLFPPREPSPENHLNLMEALWFNEGKNLATRRFAFDFDSIEKLRALAAIKQSRVEALSGLIWKCSMATSGALTGSRRTSIMVEAVNLQRRTTLPSWTVRSRTCTDGQRRRRKNRVRSGSTRATTRGRCRGMKGSRRSRAITSSWKGCLHFAGEASDILAMERRRSGGEK